MTQTIVNITVNFISFTAQGDRIMGDYYPYHTLDQ